MEEAEVVKFMKEWKDEIVKLKDDYHADIKILKEVREEIIKREKKIPWLKYLIWFAVACAILASIIIALSNPDLCKISLDLKNGFAIERCIPVTE
jgi:hypothetical protein